MEALKNASIFGIICMSIEVKDNWRIVVNYTPAMFVTLLQRFWANTLTWGAWYSFFQKHASFEWTFAIVREGTHLHMQVQNTELDGIVGINFCPKSMYCVLQYIDAIMSVKGGITMVKNLVKGAVVFTLIACCAICNLKSRKKRLTLCNIDDIIMTQKR